MMNVCSLKLSASSLVREIDPLQDARWSAFLETHPRASVFHTRGWLEALRRTYGYHPFVLTTSEPNRELHNGVVFCQIHSRLTGRRWVSLPFSDHCEPLVDEAEDLELLLGWLECAPEKQSLKYVEMRPATTRCEGQGSFVPASDFWGHRINLEASLCEIFRSFHRNCVQRKIRRAERERLSYEEGRSEPLLREFYRLLLLTRRRHRVLPQPLNWFRNLIDCLGGAVKIRVAAQRGRAIASILTLQFRDTLVYKYGCSDARFNELGGTQLLFWRAIREAKERGLREFDLGRSGYDTPGLATFKDRWGAVRSNLTYWRSGAGSGGQAATEAGGRAARSLLTYFPDPLLRMTGALAYRHLG